MCEVYILDKQILNNKRHIHFIGIGGSGMYPLAQILKNQGYHLTGSDNNETETLQAVRDMGIPVFLGQRAENIKGADLIVYSAAIMEDNPELKAAVSGEAAVMRRSELLGLITGMHENAVCISGTHGKTTVTSMLTQIMVMAGLDISAVIGGKLPLIGGSGLSGKSGVMVCEACEFKDTFLEMSPAISVILNIDEDHLDYFGTVENLISSFSKFAAKTSKAVFINGDDENSLKAIAGSDTGAEVITFGNGENNDWRPINVRRGGGMGYSFSLVHKREAICDISLDIPGIHNVLNAVAAAAVAAYCGITAEAVKKGLESFRGAARRFEKYGEINGITVVDDYAHHPAEIAATLDAALSLRFRRVIAVHQPFTFSRTAALLDDFASALSKADLTVLTSIMGSREKNTFNIYSKDLAAKIKGAVWFEEEERDANFELAADYAAQTARAGDLIITMGCGDVNKAAKLILEKLKRM